MKNVLIGLLLLNFGTIAQRKNQKELPPERAISYGIINSSNAGFLSGAMFSFASASAKITHPTFGLDIQNIKHPKESNQTGSEGRFVFGKQNYFMSVRPEFGYTLHLFEKKGSEGLGLNAIVAAGPSIGIQKPYFIKYDISTNSRESNVIVEAYDPQIHTETRRIRGATSFWRGFNQSNINIGGHLKTGLSLDVNTVGDSFVGIQVGFITEYFSKEPIIMAFTPNKQFMTSGYVSLFLGKNR